MSNITSYLKNNVYIYQKTQQVAINDPSNVSGVSGVSGASSITVEETVDIGEVKKLTFTEVINLFATGNLIKSELDSWLKSHKKYVTDLSCNESGNMLTYEFKYKNKSYTISCSKAAAESQTDSVTQNLYTIDKLKNTYKFTQEQIDKYFVLSIKNDSKEYYTLKPDCGYATASEVRTEIYNQYKNNLILANVINQKTAYTYSSGITSETKKDLYRTSDGTQLSTSNYYKYAQEIEQASGGDVTELRQKALKQFVRDFSSGNIAYAQVSTIMNALGINATSKGITKDGKEVSASSSKAETYKITFEFEGKSYDIRCNKAAAKSGLDNDIVQIYTQENLKDLGLTDENEISKYFKTVVSQGNENELFIINPDCGCQNIEEIRQAILISKTTATEGINGKIDEIVAQGGSKDCWALAGMLAIEDLSDFITQNRDGSVTVTFGGLYEYDVSYNPAILIQGSGLNIYYGDGYRTGITFSSLDDIPLDGSKKMFEEIYTKEQDGSMTKNLIYYYEIQGKKYYPIEENMSILCFHPEAYDHQESIGISFVNESDIDAMRNGGKIHTYEHGTSYTQIITDTTLYSETVNGYRLYYLKDVSGNKVYPASDNASFINSYPKDLLYPNATKLNPVSFTFTKEQIDYYNTDANLADRYSNGDNDALVMEMALDKLASALKYNTLSNVNFETRDNFDKFSGNISGTSQNGYVQQLFYYLFGANSNTTVANDLSLGLTKNQIIYSLNENPTTFTLYAGTHTATCVDGRTYTTTTLGHSLAVIDVDKENGQITFVDPHDSSQKYTMTFDEFTKLNVGMIVSAVVDKNIYSNAGSQNFRAIYTERDINYLRSMGFSDDEIFEFLEKDVDSKGNTVYTALSYEKSGLLDIYLLPEDQSQINEIKDIFKYNKVFTAEIVNSYFQGYCTQVFEPVSGTDNFFKLKEGMTLEDAEIMADCGYTTLLEVKLHKVAFETDALGQTIVDKLTNAQNTTRTTRVEAFIGEPKASVWTDPENAHSKNCSYSEYRVIKSVYNQEYNISYYYAEITYVCINDPYEFDFNDMSEPDGYGYMLQQLGMLLDEYEKAGGTYEEYDDRGFGQLHALYQKLKDVQLRETYINESPVKEFGYTSGATIKVKDAISKGKCFIKDSAGTTYSGMGMPKADFSNMMNVLCTKSLSKDTQFANAEIGMLYTNVCAALQMEQSILTDRQKAKFEEFRQVLSTGDYDKINKFLKEEFSTIQNEILNAKKINEKTNAVGNVEEYKAALKTEFRKLYPKIPKASFDAMFEVAYKRKNIVGSLDTVNIMCEQMNLFNDIYKTLSTEFKNDIQKEEFIDTLQFFCRASQMCPNGDKFVKEMKKFFTTSYNGTLEDLFKNGSVWSEYVSTKHDNFAYGCLMQAKPITVMQNMVSVLLTTMLTASQETKKTGDLKSGDDSSMTVGGTTYYHIGDWGCVPYQGDDFPPEIQNMLLSRMSPRGVERAEGVASGEIIETENYYYKNGTLMLKVMKWSDLAALNKKMAVDLSAEDLFNDMDLPQNGLIGTVDIDAPSNSPQGPALTHNMNPNQNKPTIHAFDFSGSGTPGNINMENVNPEEEPVKEEEPENTPEIPEVDNSQASTQSGAKINTQKLVDQLNNLISQGKDVAKTKIDGMLKNMLDTIRSLPDPKYQILADIIESYNQAALLGLVQNFFVMEEMIPLEMLDEYIGKPMDDKALEMLREINNCIRDAINRRIPICTTTDNCKVKYYEPLAQLMDKLEDYMYDYLDEIDFWQDEDSFYTKERNELMSAFEMKGYNADDLENLEEDFGDAMTEMAHLISADEDVQDVLDKIASGDEDALNTKIHGLSVDEMGHSRTVDWLIQNGKIEDPHEEEPSQPTEPEPADTATEGTTNDGRNDAVVAVDPEEDLDEFPYH